MIPKIIHYCWLSDNPMPQEEQDYIKSWHQLMPDYMFKKWDRKAINLDEHPFAKQAFENGKYAFASDYIRAYALYNYGGIYLDSDVLVLKSFDEFLDASYFTSVENVLSPTNYNLLKGRFIDNDGTRLPGMNCHYLGLQAAIVGAEKGGKLITDIYEFYKKQDYVQPDGSVFHRTAPNVHAFFAEKYGFKYKDCPQALDDRIFIYPSSYFATKGINVSERTFAIHCCRGSWVKDYSGLKKYFRKINFIMDLYLKLKIIFKVNDTNLMK